MSEKYKFHDPEGLYFVTCTIVHWIDLFTRKELKHVIVESLKYCQDAKGLIIHAWCLMPSHLHMIISTRDKPLSEIMRDFKKFTSKRIVKELGTVNESRKEWLIRAFEKAGKELKRISTVKVWQDGNQPKSIESNHFLEQKLDYIHNNPVEDEIVEEAHDYLFSSARDYSGIRGLIDVEILE
ncbi:MAG: transposase [Cyclobacteriaceae bacterium]